MKRTFVSIVATLLVVVTAVAFRATVPGSEAVAGLPQKPVVDWSLEAQRAIVPPPAGVGDKFPGMAAVYMGLVHAAIYDAAVAIEGRYQPYAVEVSATANTAPAAAIAAAAHGVLVGLLPTQQSDLDDRYAEYFSRLPDTAAKTNGIDLGDRIAAAILALRANDGRHGNTEYLQRQSGPGVFEPDPTRPLLGLRLATFRPLALDTPWQFRPDGPTPVTSQEYAADFEEVKTLGRLDSVSRTDEQTSAAIFWTDHDVRQWNEGMLRLAADRDLDFIETARMLALAHVSGGDAMIACFDAKYHYGFWRPVSAIAQADTDGNPATERDATWRPLRTTSNFPEYPSAHACHSSAVVEALAAFFGTDDLHLSLDSKATGTTRTFDLRDIVEEVEQARVLAGFHFRNSDLEARASVARSHVS